MSSLPIGWRIQRNANGTIGLFAPMPKVGESQRTSEMLSPGPARDLEEIIYKLLWQMLEQDDNGKAYKAIGLAETLGYSWTGVGWLKPDGASAKRHDGMPASMEERKLRRMLATRAGFPHLYCDDGEAQGEDLGITIDFMRDNVNDIDAKLVKLNRARYLKASVTKL